MHNDHYYQRDHRLMVIIVVNGKGKDKDAPRAQPPPDIHTLSTPSSRASFATSVSYRLPASPVNKTTIS